MLAGEKLAGEMLAGEMLACEMLATQGLWALPFSLLEKKGGK